MCKPEQEGNGRCSLAYCQLFSDRRTRTSSHPDGQIRSKHKVVFDNTPTTAHLATSSLPLHSKVKNISKTSERTVKDAFAHQDKPLIECKSEVNDDYTAPTAQLASAPQPYKEVRKARKEMLRDASTFTDKGRKEGLRTNNLKHNEILCVDVQA
ncbi:hypothetical protein V3C99_015399 [Haemonchus contortus]